jgi:DNA-binding protein WhiA
MKLKKNNQYLVRLQQQVKQIMEDLQIWDDQQGFITRVPATIKNSRVKAMSYLRGAFLAGGSVNNPETSRYHLEIYSTYQDHNHDLAKLMNDYFYLNAKETSRRRGYIVYLKEAEKIGDFLHVVGAVHAMLAFEDLRIMRDMRNSVNRLVNCDTANMKKTASAAAKQVEDIELIQAKQGLDQLPEKLQVLARFRLANSELSLKEVAERVPDGPISKSGVNHRFKKIHDYAEKLRLK